MIVKNWMSKNPITISSDLLAKEAMDMFEEHKVPFLSVVDDEQFRGLLAKRDLFEAASWAVSTQDIFEIQYFNERLKVRDIMVRMPVTLSVNDTMETALDKGKQFTRSFLPVMDGNKLVGTLSNRDFIHTLNQILGVDEDLHGVAVEINDNSKGTIKEVIEEIFAMGLEIKGLFTLKNPDSQKQRLLIRFETKCLSKITALLEEKNYKIIEVEKP